MADCRFCGDRLGWGDSQGVCSKPPCLKKHRQEQKELGVLASTGQERTDRILAENEAALAIEEAALATEIDAITLTTESLLEGVRVKQRKGVITAECAYGMNVFKDIFAGIRNIVGGRSAAVQKTMRDARETVLSELKQEAHRVGANAVIAVDLDYTQIGDKGWNMVLLIASGTAVVIEEKSGNQGEAT